MKILPLYNSLLVHKKINTKSKIANNSDNIGYEYRFQKYSYLIKYPEISFMSAITPQKELINICKNSEYENYNSSKENMEQGVFQIDLHSHSNYSDGHGEVEKLLNQAAKYGDELFSKTGKQFTFALTDHDGIAGVKKALECIDNNRFKFKNVNFVPGAELSFAFPSDNEVKFGEILVYYLDPNSKESEMIIGRVRKNREKMINDFIKTLGNGYSRQDLEKYFIDGDETFAYSLHSRLRNYAQIKTRINKMAQEYDMPNDKLYKDLMDRYVFRKGYRIQKPNITPEGFDEFFKENSIYTYTGVIDNSIEEICNQFYPKIINGKVISDTENSFEDIMNILKSNNDVLIGFAHPYFTAKQMKDFHKEFENLLQIAGRRIVFSENYHQSYPQIILNSPEEQKYINEVNDFLLSKGLIAMGGRDNHSPNLI